MNMVKIAGYGTFITDGLRNLDKDMATTVWGRPVQVVGATKIEGWSRVTPPNHHWAVVIPDKTKKWWQFWKGDVAKSFFYTLVIEVPEKLFPAIDNIEGYPFLYDRVQVQTTLGMVWMYVPAEDSSAYKAVQRALSEGVEMEDTWAQEIREVENEFAKATFPQFFEGGEA